mgnify:CR=1 FL=1
MSDFFELDHNFDPLESAEGTFDTDFYGVNNADEAQANTDPLRDDQAPVITPPQAVHVYADHTYTKLDLATLIDITQVAVEDGKDGVSCCNLTPLALKPAVRILGQGYMILRWQPFTMPVILPTKNRGIMFIL